MTRLSAQKRAQKPAFPAISKQMSRTLRSLTIAAAAVTMSSQPMALPQHPRAAAAPAAMQAQPLQVQAQPPQVQTLLPAAKTTGSSLLWDPLVALLAEGREPNTEDLQGPHLQDALNNNVISSFCVPGRRTAETLL